MTKNWIILAPLALCLCGCPLTSRTEQKQVDTHRDEHTEVTKTTRTKGTQGGQPVDVVTTETTTSKTVRDDSSTSQSKAELSSPALDHAAASLEQLAASMANAYAPGSGGIVTGLMHAVGLNDDTAAGLASAGAAGVAFLAHRRGKKKGHEEAKKPPKLP